MLAAQVLLDLAALLAALGSRGGAWGGTLAAHVLLDHPELLGSSAQDAADDPKPLQVLAAQVLLDLADLGQDATADLDAQRLAADDPGRFLQSAASRWESGPSCAPLAADLDALARASPALRPGRRRR